ncbi:hypothetical protein QL285_002697 [Trifolium repens]|nr:hypothetical protein QL285_002697 [Trifolium repens]
MMYPRVKVRVTEQEDYLYPENDSGILAFLKLIESLHFEEEENQSKSQPSISTNTKACPKHIITRRFTPSTKGILKNSKRVSEVPKENTRASSIIRPRAVLSSPDNDELIGSINDSNNNITLTKRKKDTRGTVGGNAKEEEDYVYPENDSGILAFLKLIESLHFEGKFFASQYYGLLCGEPDQMRHFYSEHSTLIHVINGDDDDATRITSDLDKIEKYLSDFNIDTVEIKSTNSLNCWVLGEKRGNRGYFIMIDILHIINHNYQVKSQDIDPRLLSESKLPPLTDNGNLDEAKVEKMSIVVNRIEFPALPKRQQVPRQRGFDSSVWKTPLAIVAKIDDTIQKNIDAPKIEESMVVQEEPFQNSNKSDDSDLPTSTSRGRGRGRNNSSGRGAGDMNKGKENQNTD